MAASVVKVATANNSNNRTPLQSLGDNDKNIHRPPRPARKLKPKRKRNNVYTNNNNNIAFQPSFLLPSPPPTDPDKTSQLWARVRSITHQEKRMPRATPKPPSVSTAEEKEKTAGKGTNDYRIQELKPRHITIVQASARPETWLPPNAPTASKAELEGLYVPLEDDEFLDTVRSWAKSCLDVSNPALPEFQWTADVYLRFLRARNKPHCAGEEDTIKLERSLQPWVTLKPNEAILLPPKEVLSADGSSVNTRGKQSKRKRVSVLPDEIQTDGGGGKESGSASKVQQTAMRPDIMYASNIALLEDVGKYLNYPAMRTFAASDRLPPYIIGEFKSTRVQAVEAQQPLALLGAMMLLERVKLRRMSSNLALDDIKLFMLTCCGPLVDIYCMVIRTTGDRCKAGELLSYDMNRCSTYVLVHKGDIKRLGGDLNSIHAYGQTTHLDGIKSDLAAASPMYLADLDKRSYQYTDSNQFASGDELVMGQDRESSITSADDLSSSAAVSNR